MTDVCWLCRRLAEIRAAVEFGGAYVVTLVSVGMRGQCRSLQQALECKLTVVGRKVCFVVTFNSSPGVVLAKPVKSSACQEVRAAHPQFLNFATTPAEVQVLLQDHDCADRQSDVN